MDFDRIDLHLHTTVSDGTDTPETIIGLVKKAKVGLFSVTDHDAVKACDIVRKALSETDPYFINGVEFSCRDDFGKYHILGYGYRRGASPIETLVEQGHMIRMRRLVKRLDSLEMQFGVSFPEDAIAMLLTQDNPGKPHIAELMVEYGYAENTKAAFKRYLDGDLNDNESMRPEDAIRGILESGGIPILAHPSYGDGHQLISGEKMEQRLKRMIGYGLQGVEAYYSGFTTTLSEEMLCYAQRYDLYITAGSDYHGRNKSVAIGDIGPAWTGDMPEGMRLFLKALAMRIKGNW